MSRHLHSVLFGIWAMQPEAARAYLPQVMNLLNGTGRTLSMDQLRDMRAAHEPYAMQASGPGGSTGGSAPGDVVKVKVIPVNGPVLKYGGECTYGMVDYAKELAKADDDRNIIGTVIDIDTPGGEAGGMTMLYDAIRRAKKPVVGIVQSGMAASAGMGIAAACDKVYASRETDKFGSIGMYCTLPDMRKFWEAQGLTLHEVYADQSTEKNREFLEALQADPNDPADPHYARLKNEHINPFVDSFIRMMVTARPAMAATKEQWAKGQMLSAKDAVKAGLIDGFTTLEGAVAEVMKLSKTKNAENGQLPKAQPTTEHMNIKEMAAGFLAGVKNYFASDADVTEQTLAMANASLDADGITKMRVVSTERLDGVEAAEARALEAESKLEAATAEASTLKEQLDGAEAKVQGLEAAGAEALKAAALEVGEGENALDVLVGALAAANAKSEEQGTQVEDLTAKLDAATTDIAALKATIAKLENEAAPDAQPGKVTNAKGDGTPGGSPANEAEREFYASVQTMVDNM